MCRRCNGVARVDDAMKHGSDRAKIWTRHVRDRSARSASRTHRARRHIARSRTSRTGSTSRDWNEERIVVQILSGLDTPRPGAPTGGTRRKLGESSITGARHDIGPPNSLESTSSPRAARQIRCGNPPSYRAIWAPDRVCFFPDINNAAENARRADTNLVVRATGAVAMVMEAEAILSVLLTGVLGYERRLATAVPCVVMARQPSKLDKLTTLEISLQRSRSCSSLGTATRDFPHKIDRRFAGFCPNVWNPPIGQSLFLPLYHQ